MYSVASRASFDQVGLHLDDALRGRSQERLPLVLVGNKCDLEDARAVSVQVVCGDLECAGA